LSDVIGSARSGTSGFVLSLVLVLALVSCPRFFPWGTANAFDFGSALAFMLNEGIARERLLAMLHQLIPLARRQNVMGAKRVA